MKFVKLTPFGGGKPLWLNLATVVTIRDNGRDGSTVRVLGDDQAQAQFDVAEAPDKILGLAGVLPKPPASGPIADFSEADPFGEGR